MHIKYRFEERERERGAESSPKRITHCATGTEACIQRRKFLGRGRKGVKAARAENRKVERDEALRSQIAIRAIKRLQSGVNSIELSGGGEGGQSFAPPP